MSANPKAVAAFRAVEFVKDGMTVGLGTGSTAAFAVSRLGERIRNEKLTICAVPTSSATQALALQAGIPLVDLKDMHSIDITIDGADEVDSSLSLIKGGGGALVREKIVAAASRRVIIICDESKIKKTLGRFPLPVAVVEFGWQATRSRLLELCPTVTLRTSSGLSTPFLTDEGCLILDMHFTTIADPADLERRIKVITGVVEVGLFVNIATNVVIGRYDGTSEIINSEIADRVPA